MDPGYPSRVTLLSSWADWRRSQPGYTEHLVEFRAQAQASGFEHRQQFRNGARTGLHRCLKARKHGANAQGAAWHSLRDFFCFSVAVSYTNLFFGGCGSGSDGRQLSASMFTATRPEPEPHRPSPKPEPGIRQTPTGTPVKLNRTHPVT